MTPSQKPQDGGAVTLNAALRKLGYVHVKSSISGKRDVRDPAGDLVGTFSAKEAWDWIAAREAQP